MNLHCQQCSNFLKGMKNVSEADWKTNRVIESHQKENRIMQPAKHQHLSSRKITRLENQSLFISMFDTLNRFEKEKSLRYFLKKISHSFFFLSFSFFFLSLSLSLSSFLSLFLNLPTLSSFLSIFPLFHYHLHF